MLDEFSCKFDVDKYQMVDFIKMLKQSAKKHILRYEIIHYPPFTSNNYHDMDKEIVLSLNDFSLELLMHDRKKTKELCDKLIECDKKHYPKCIVCGVGSDDMLLSCEAVICATESPFIKDCNRLHREFAERVYGNPTIAHVACDSAVDIYVKPLYSQQIRN